MINRGLKQSDIPHYLNTTSNDLLNPCLIRNVIEGAKMLARHIKNNDDIFIQVDADCDGFTSAAVLLNWMYGYFPYYTTHHVIYRIHDDKYMELLQIPFQIILNWL